jgi:aconitate hydratase 2/2-methylisocitrate dehydratase
MRRMIADGYRDAATLQERIAAAEAWLRDPQLLRADRHAEYAAVIEIDLGEIREPLVCCPNDPDDVRPLSEVAGTAIEDVFIGSCMSNIGHFRAAAALWQGRGFNAAVRTWLCPPTRMDQQQLREEGLFPVFSAVGGRIETAGCSLCMGNQARVPDNARVFSTSTRNFDNRMGDGAQVWLGSAALAAMVTVLGRIPTAEEYFRLFEEKIAPAGGEIFRGLQFDEMEGYRQ